MLLDRNDIFNNGINPHHYCLPILKKSLDKDALIKAATSGACNFFLGTDSAPQAKHSKLSSCGCAGIFNSPVAVEVTTQIFDTVGKLEMLERFMTTNGCDFYGLEYPKEYVKIEERTWTVPNEMNNVVPLCAGQNLNWSIV